MKTRYTSTAIALHWIIAALIALNIALALASKALQGGDRQQILDLHKSLGITVLGLVLVRLTWRCLHRPPALPASYPDHERVAAHSAHILLYIIMITLPLSGWVRDSAWKLAALNPMKLFFLIPWPRLGFVMDLDPTRKALVHYTAGTVHEWLGFALYFLVIVHIAGVLKHQLMDYEGVMPRMLPWKPRDDEGRV